MRRNVLELIGSFRQGGSEGQAVQLSRLLHEERSFRIFVGCLDSAGILRTEIEQLGIASIPEFKLTSFYNANFLLEARRCANYIKENEIGIVHTHDFYTNIFGMLAAYLARTPVRIASKRETFSKSRNQLLIERQSFRLADKIVANADAVRQFLVNTGVPEEKVTTIYNGLDLQKFTPKDVLDRLNLLIAFKLPLTEKMFYITIVANLSSDIKNHRMFLRAARRVKDEIKNVTFILAGEGELINSLKSFARELKIQKDVVFTGGCSNVGDLLSISDICVLSSRSEGFSNSILEYMSAAKPVVATDVGGAREAIIDGETGFLVESDNDERMAGRLIELLRDPKLAIEMGQKGRRIVEDRFSLTAQTEKTLSLYRTLLREKALL